MNGITSATYCDTCAETDAKNGPWVFKMTKTKVNKISADIGDGSCNYTAVVK